MALNFHFHWLTITVWVDREDALKLWDEAFVPILGQLAPSFIGHRGFRGCFRGLLGSKLFTDPALLNNKNQYASIVLPGAACEVIPPFLVHSLYSHILNGLKYRTTRLDFAWDDVGFTPSDVAVAINDGHLRSSAKRRSLNIYKQPFEEREDNEIGTSSTRLGSVNSTRLLSVYDKHGPIRLELQARKARADLYANELFKQKPEKWPNLAMGYLRDFVDFEKDGKLFPWWEHFVNGVPRARRQIQESRQKETQRMTKWVMTQVAPTLSVLVDIHGESFLGLVVKNGRQTRGNRFNALLEDPTKRKEI